MKEAVDKVKQVAVRSLTRNVLAALENSTLQIEAQAMQFTNVQLPPIREESQAIAERFMTNLNDYFDALTTLKAKDTDVSDYGKLSLVDHDYLEAIIAMEGMVNHARNSDIQQYISFTTRLDSTFPNLRIDETNNPLDPEQIGDCFNEAIRPLGLKAHYLLTIYREFNKAVFHHLEEVLADANEVLIKLEVLPKLDIKARNKELQKAKRAASRPTTDAETRAFSDIETSKVQKQTQKKETESKAEQPNVEMFAMMQTLVKGLAGQGDALSINPPTANPESTTQTEDILAEQQNLQKQHTQLMATLSDIQNRLNLSDTSIGAEENSIDSNFVSESISKTLEENGSQNGIEAIDVQSSDVINLVTLLYKAIWNDDSLPLVMKELIGRTQISIMKIVNYQF